jgi:hypothetical protein
MVLWKNLMLYLFPTGFALNKDILNNWNLTNCFLFWTVTDGIWVSLRMTYSWQNYAPWWFARISLRINEDIQLKFELWFCLGLLEMMFEFLYARPTFDWTLYSCNTLTMLVINSLSYLSQTEFWYLWRKSKYSCHCFSNASQSGFF